MTKIVMYNDGRMTKQYVTYTVFRISIGIILGLLIIKLAGLTW